MPDLSGGREMFPTLVPELHWEAEPYFYTPHRGGSSFMANRAAYRKSNSTVLPQSKMVLVKADLSAFKNCFVYFKNKLLDRNLFML